SCFTVVILVYLLGGFHPHTQTIRHSQRTRTVDTDEIDTAPDRRVISRHGTPAKQARNYQSKYRKERGKRPATWPGMCGRCHNR
ncbi:hypothetical protein, partial [Actinotignum sp. GS-2025b]|uniref:hypothetical protein n=1 Tax=Actinotignum sp. GS-2025b TaxID=3427275 RepID=UPI003F4600F7